MVLIPIVSDDILAGVVVPVISASIVVIAVVKLASVGTWKYVVVAGTARDPELMFVVVSELSVVMLVVLTIIALVRLAADPFMVTSMLGVACNENGAMVAPVTVVLIIPEVLVDQPTAVPFEIIDLLALESTSGLVLLVLPVMVLVALVVLDSSGVLRVVLVLVMLLVLVLVWLAVLVWPLLVLVLVVLLVLVIFLPDKLVVLIGLAMLVLVVVVELVEVV